MAAKQLKIKTGVLKRCNKDLIYYKKEFSSQQTKVEKMRSEGKDKHDIKQQVQVLEETESMLPDCQSRLVRATKDLQAYIEENKEEADVAGSELLTDAQELLETINAAQ